LFVVAGVGAVVLGDTTHAGAHEAGNVAAARWYLDNTPFPGMVRSGELE
jgi:hypothetical protein